MESSLYLLEPKIKVINEIYSRIIILNHTLSRIRANFCLVYLGLPLVKTESLEALKLENGDSELGEVTAPKDARTSSDGSQRKF